jgi:hypothetical protein
MTLSPSKRSKKMDGTPSKVSKFILTDGTKTVPSSLKLSSQMQGLSSSVPSSMLSTPTIDLRGSLPQNRRVSLLSSSRRIKTPFRRIDPLNKASALPFSIDAALSGTISSYTPPAPSVTTPAAETTPPAPVLSKKPAKSMPNTWFFEIHEDTPDQEATNLMEHSASVLDISSDDDSVSARAKDAQERGKENVPPPEWTGPTRSARSAPRTAHKGIKCPKKAAKYAAMQGGPDAMVEDRSALREMDVTAFWVDEEEEKVVEQPAQEQPEALVTSPTDDTTTPVTPVEQTSLVAEPVEAIVIREDTPEAEKQTPVPA